MTPRALRFALAWACTAGLLLAFWLFLVDTPEEPQVLAGLVVAAIGATGSELVRHQRIARARPRARWLARLWRPLASVPADLWRLGREAGRAVLPGRVASRGRFRELPFRAGHEDPVDVARRALAEAGGSFSPNTYVVGVDVERGTILVHQLVPREDRPADSIDPLALR
jgi:multisubunit Na+/H+ antiporter MnhE subunit